MMRSPCPTNSRMRRTYSPGCVPGVNLREVVAERVGAGEIEIRQHVRFSKPLQIVRIALPFRILCQQTEFFHVADRDQAAAWLKAGHVQRPDVTRKAIELKV